MLEKIFSWYDHFIQSMVWQAVIDRFHWIDWCTVVFLVIGLIYGFRNGFMGEIAEVLELLVINFLVFKYSEKVAVFLYTNVRRVPQKSVDALSFILTAAVVWFAVVLVVRLMKKVVHADVAKPLRYIGGMIMGAFHLVLLLSFLCQALIRMPVHTIQQEFAEGTSYTGYYLAHLAPRFFQIVNEPLATIKTQSS